MQLPVEKPYKPVPFVEQPTFENIEISRLESPILLNYLADRGIPRDIAQRYCVQVDYTLHGKRYYAIGFENNAHGYELRNPFFKGAYPPKNNAPNYRPVLRLLGNTLYPRVNPLVLL